MKNNPRLFTYVVTIIGCAYLLVNLKKHFFDPVWDYFCILLIFILNGTDFIKYLKEKK